MELLRSHVSKKIYNLLYSFKVQNNINWFRILSSSLQHFLCLALILSDYPCWEMSHFSVLDQVFILVLWERSKQLTEISIELACFEHVKVSLYPKWFIDHILNLRHSVIKGELDLCSLGCCIQRIIVLDSFAFFIKCEERFRLQVNLKKLGSSLVSLKIISA